MCVCGVWKCQGEKERVKNQLDGHIINMASPEGESERGGEIRRERKRDKSSEQRKEKETEQRPSRRVRLFCERRKALISHPLSPAPKRWMGMHIERTLKREGGGREREREREREKKKRRRKKKSED